jgi:hypothetical protein
MKKKCMLMIEKYFEGKQHKIFDGKGWRIKYSSSAGKFGLSNLMVEGLVEECSGTEVKLMLAILSNVKRSSDIIESGCVKLVSTEYRKVCSRRVFGDAIRKFVALEYLVPTLDSRWYILNPRYINKFYSVRVSKEESDNKK